MTNPTGLSRTGAEIVEALSGFLDSMRQGDSIDDRFPVLTLSHPHTTSDRMPAMPHAKPNLPTKVCPACGRPFVWRKKWARDWDSVVYCSDRCRRAGKPGQGGGRPAG